MLTYESRIICDVSFGLKHFLDTSTLLMYFLFVITGKAWQRTLYHSIDGSRCLLALVSENYIKSPVCQEEYNLALAKHCSAVNTGS